MSRANPNPVCHVCGKPTRTMDYYTQWNRHKLMSNWCTSCSNTKCANCSTESAISGRGPTMKAARDDYRKKAAEFNEGKP